jgi:hypothetical protein
MLAFPMLHLGFKMPNIIFWLTIIFLIKDIFLDYNLIKIERPRVYWAEHAPLSLVIFTIGTFGLLGINFFVGYVGLITTLLAGINFLLDFYKDLTESPTVYFR